MVSSIGNIQQLVACIEGNSSWAEAKAEMAADGFVVEAMSAKVDEPSFVVKSRSGREYARLTEYDPIRSAVNSGYVGSDIIEMVEGMSFEKDIRNAHLQEAVYRFSREEALKLAQLNPSAIDDRVLSSAISHWSDNKTDVIALASLDNKTTNTAVSFTSAATAIKLWEDDLDSVVALLCTHPEPLAVKRFESFLQSEVARKGENFAPMADSYLKQISEASKEVAAEKGYLLDEREDGTYRLNSLQSESYKAAVSGRQNLVVMVVNSYMIQL